MQIKYFVVVLNLSVIATQNVFCGLLHTTSIYVGSNFVDKMLIHENLCPIKMCSLTMYGVLSIRV